MGSSKRYGVAGIGSAFSGPNDRDGKIPVLFQVLSPDYETTLLPEAMYMHVNPSELSFDYNKEVERIQTRSGDFVEQHFGEQLTDLSANNTSGAFINVEEGLTISNRKDTIAYEKFQHLIELFHNNGLLYDNRGNIQYRGRIRITFEGGVYDGAFRSISIDETASEPFNLKADWSFRVEKEVNNLVF